MFAGNQADVVPWLQALDVFALPSYANEGVPQALVQAMLVGLPCVTTNVGGIPELAIARADRARRADGGRECAARRPCSGLLSDPGLARRPRRCGAHARAANFSYQRMLDRMERHLRVRCRR